MKTYNKGSAGTFALNKKEPIHRWYSYIEGYSSCLISDIFNELGNSITSVYEPFAGTGTTLLVASNKNIKSYYSETNPFMRDVIEAKINMVKKLKESNIKADNIKTILNNINKINYIKPVSSWDGFEKFFDKEVLSEILTIKEVIENSIADYESKKIALIALASIIVKVSNMVRQGDLRYARENEKSFEDKRVKENYVLKLQEIIADIENEETQIFQNTVCLHEDAKMISETDLVDCVITSPPYLNGTNYIRNTKLELKLTDYILSDKDMPNFHSKGIVAGINNVSKRKSNIDENVFAKKYLELLKPVSYDDRIPMMISGYFNDMEIVIKNLSKIIKDNGYFIMDIGDSQFAGIHIPTHEILIKICEKYGFCLYEDEVLRERRSKNGMVLSQRLLKFKLQKNANDKVNALKTKAINFIKDLPYKKEPYNGKNWGDGLHSLCSYQGKLKPAIAHFLIKEFTKKNDIVLDPLCGVGTIPLEACLQGRFGIGNDLSEIAYIVTKAKLQKPEIRDVYKVLEDLEQFIETYKNLPLINNLVEQQYDFGFNGKLVTYYHENTFKEIVCAREYFNNRFRDLTPAEAMCQSCILHILHGNRPYALSRTSHPLTPYSPKGDYIYKNLIQHTKNKIDLVYKKESENDYIKGNTIWGDYNNLPQQQIKADAIICSPPFADSIKFYMQNWLRLWFCGWNKEDFDSANSKFLDTKQKKNFDIYFSFFDMCYEMLKEDGIIILHLGKTEKIDMAEELSKRLNNKFSIAYIGEEDVSMLEKHGIKDKGGTIKHQYMFLIKK